MSEPKSFTNEVQSKDSQLSSEGTLSAAPPAFQLQASSQAPIQRQEQTPDQDHTSGTLREISYLRTSNLRTRQTEEGQRIFFREGDTVNMVREAPNNFQWIEVSGTAYRGSASNPIEVGVRTGYIVRAWTTMTVGVYDGLNVDDRTETSTGNGNDVYSDLGTDREIIPDEVILHQTMSTTADSTLRTYRNNIARGSHIGAQYLVDPAGRIILVVPANERVYHDPGSKRKRLTPPSVRPGAEGFTEQMATVRQEIDNYYHELTSLSIPADQHEQLLGMSDEDLYALLVAQRWEIYGEVGNNTSVGIEFVGYPERITPGSRTSAAAVRAEIAGFNLAPELKAQLLQTAERTAIEANEGLSPEEREQQLAALDQELFDLLRDYDWYIYVDITPEQKYASWMLVQKLVQDYGLDINNDVLGHNQTHLKTLGEGENNMEFIRTMAEFVETMALMEQLAAQNGTALEGELADLQVFRDRLQSLNGGQMLQAGEDGYDEMIAFFRDFYANNQRLLGAVAAMQAGN